MTPSLIEETIIAYLDGRLSDAESAELLHLVSVSPEIRRTFREHEQLRTVARQARVNAMVRPELEDRLFAHIESLEEKSRVIEEVAVPFWARSRVALLFLALILGTGVYFGYESLRDGNRASGSFSSTNKEIPSLPSPRSATAAPSSDAASRSDVATIGPAGANQTASNVPATLYGALNKNWNSAPVSSHASNEPVILTSQREHLVQLTQAIGAQHAEQVDKIIMEWEAESCSRDELGLDPIVHPVTFEVPDILASYAAIPIRPVADEDDTHAGKLEMMLVTSTGFMIQPVGLSVPPIGDVRASLAYPLLGSSDLLGVRVAYTKRDGLATPATSQGSSGSVLIQRNLEMQQVLSFGGFYTHRFNVMDGKLELDGTFGFGYSPSTTSAESTTILSLEFGANVPLGRHFFLSAGAGLMRYHSNALTLEELARNKSMSSGLPVLLEGSDVRNTLSGRLFYGISYRF